MNYAITAVRWNADHNEIIEAKMHEIVVTDDEGQRDLQLLPAHATAKINIVSLCHSDLVHVAIRDGADNYILTDSIRTAGQNNHCRNCFIDSNFRNSIWTSGIVFT